jgi:hypothetical protein
MLPVFQATRELYLRSVTTCLHWQCFSRNEHIKRDKTDVACAIHVGGKVGEEGANTYNALIGKRDGKNRVAHLIV